MYVSHHADTESQHVKDGVITLIVSFNTIVSNNHANVALSTDSFNT
ncbi:hypothetical protein HOF65_02210 [bacterium]|nr:hypothetical protein [bacterium]MBT3852816.1 hypothetical protein [bacterium]MBT4632591.1 hypothetical protein [bacterium]MBT6778224.1 hypothetical protein [bacterium]